MLCRCRFSPLFTMGVVALTSLGCLVADLAAPFLSSSPQTAITETAPLYGMGTPVPVSGERITADNAIRMTLLTRLGNGVVSSGVKWSPDGRTLAFPTIFGVYLFDVDTLEPIRLIAEPPQMERIGQTSQPVRINSLEFSPDGSLLAYWTSPQSISNPTVRLRRVSDGSLVRELKGERWVGGSVFSPDGTLMATQSEKDSARLWRVSDGKLMRELVKLVDNGDKLQRIAVSPDWSVMATWSGSTPILGQPIARPIRLWRVSDGSFLRDLKEVGSENILFNPDGSQFITVDVHYATPYSVIPDTGTTIRFWRLSDVSLMHETSVPYAASNITFTPDGSLLALSDGGTLRLVRVADGTVARELQLPESVAFSPDGSLLAATDTLRLWRASDGSLVRESKDWYPLGDTSFSSDARLVKSYNRVWRVSPDDPDGIFTPVSELKGRGDYGCPVFSPDRSLLATGSSQGLQLWRVSDGTMMREWKGRYCNVAFSPDSSLMASITQDYVLQLWRVSDGSLVRELQDPNGITDVWFSPDGALLASKSLRNATVQLWHVSDGSVAQEFKGATWGTVVSFSPDSRLVTFETAKDTARVWRVSDGGLVRELNGAIGGRLTFSPDGRFAASNGGLAQQWVGDDTVRLWRVSDWSVVRDLKGASGLIAYSPDGTLLVTHASRELGVLQLWRLGDASLVREFKGQSDYVTSVAFSQDGRLIMSASRDGTLGLWGIPVAGSATVPLKSH